MNTENAIKIFDAGGLKVTWAVPEKHIINFFWPNLCKFEIIQVSLFSPKAFFTKLEIRSYE